MAFAKIQVTAQIRLETGLHIGTSNAFAAIGATDSPVTYPLFLVQVSKGRCAVFFQKFIIND